MIVDSSAVVAILIGEPDADPLANKLTVAPRPRMSAATYLELSIVMENKGGPRAGYELDDFIAGTEIEIIPVTLEQAEAARIAWRRFGKGNHPARLKLRRLLLLCPSQNHRRTAALQRQRFRSDRY